MNGRGQHVLPGDGPLLREVPLPPQPPLEFEPDMTDLRVVALQAATRSVQAAPGEPAAKTHREVLSAANEYLKWLEDA